jgi:ribosomal-protein-alanine N-acetyltransferase
MPTAGLIAFARDLRIPAAAVRAASGLRVETARLELVACSSELARASLEGPATVRRLLGVAVPPTWPPSELTEALALYASPARADEAAAGWGIWLLVSTSERSLVGSAGFKGAPDRWGCVEVGYGIEPGFRRRGFASEALEALVEWAWGGGVRRIVAECHDANQASARVLQRVGMRLVERRGRMLWWELRNRS